MNKLLILFKRPHFKEHDDANRSGITNALGTKTLPALLTRNISVNSRGISDIESSTVTSEFGGKFKDPQARREFLDYIKLETKF
jgi:GTP cyclohydrolase I